MEEVKVLQIIPNLAKGGAERICIDICQEFKLRGVEVEIVTFNRNIEYPINGLTVRFFDLLGNVSFSRKNTKDFVAFVDYVKSYNPSIVHTHLFAAELIWKITELNYPSVFHIHDNIKSFDPFANGYFQKQNWIKLYEKIKYKKLLKKQPTHFLSISKDSSNYIKDKLGLKESQESLLLNAINRTKFLNKTSGFDLSKINLVSVGSLVPKKGHSYLIEVVKELIIKTDLEVELKILGDGPLKDFLKEEVKDCGLDDCIIFLGKVDSPEQFMWESNCYIHGAYEEPFGLVLIEAMAAGIPVFTTDGGGNRDIINHGENGFIFYSREPAKMAQAIVDLFENSRGYQKISNAGVEFTKNYDISIYCDNLINLYRGLMS